MYLLLMYLMFIPVELIMPAQQKKIFNFADVKALAISAICKVEGGYTRCEKHGFVNRGISPALYKFYYGKDADVKNLTNEHAVKIYGDLFDKHCGKIVKTHPAASVMYFDLVVNFGASGAKKIINIPKDFTELQNFTDYALLKEIDKRKRLCRKNGNPKYKRGWKKRDDYILNVSSGLVLKTT